MDDLFYRKKKRRFDPQQILRLFRNKRLVAALAIGLPLIGFVLFGNRGIVQRVRLERQEAELQQKIREAEAETRRLQTELKALEGDPKAIEKAAREKHGMVRDGETVYKTTPAR
jgi:cell division protein FtsB